MFQSLADQHDLAVLIERLAADPRLFGGSLHAMRVIDLARAQQNDLRRRAFRTGATVYAERPRAFVARFAAYWKASAGQGGELAVGGIAELAAAAKPSRAGGAQRPVPPLLTLAADGAEPHHPVSDAIA